MTNYKNETLGLTISYLNIEGVHSKILGCKIPHIEKYLNSDIEILAESRGSCKHDKGLKDYHLIEVKLRKLKDIKKGRKSGGLLIYFKNFLLNHIKMIKSGKLCVVANKKILFKNTQ